MRVVIQLLWTLGLGKWEKITSYLEFQTGVLISYTRKWGTSEGF